MLTFSADSPKAENQGLFRCVFFFKTMSCHFQNFKTVLHLNDITKATKIDRFNLRESAMNSNETLTILRND